VDDGKSTLIGRLLVDSKAVLQDQLANVSKSGEADLALFTDGLSAEREQGITIDVAYRYFATPRRKFIIGDAPGHEQYTRNMVTAASSAHAAVVLVDATKLKWNADGLVDLLPQTRRHSLLVNLLRVPGIIFAVNKLDALGDDATAAFAKISEALQAFAEQAGIAVTATIPDVRPQGPQRGGSQARAGAATRALACWNCWRRCPLPPLRLMCPLPSRCNGLKSSTTRPTPPKAAACSGAAWPPVPCRWATPSASTQRPDCRGGTGGEPCPAPGSVAAGHGAGITLDREVDVSRGDWLLAQVRPPQTRTTNLPTRPSPVPLPKPPVKSRPLWPG